MGIDKPDVRYVVHFNCRSVRLDRGAKLNVAPLSVPSSLEGYYQETGRAGRDGLPSTCVLYFSFKDIRVHERFINEANVSFEQKQSQREILNKVLQYCINTADCRRTQVLQYFGEKFTPSQCKETCDNCRMNKGSVPETQDVTSEAKDIVSLVRAINPGKVTMSTVVDVFYGSKSKKVGRLSPQLHVACPDHRDSRSPNPDTTNSHRPERDRR